MLFKKCIAVMAGAWLLAGAAAAEQDQKRLPFFMPDVRGITVEEAEIILEGSEQLIHFGRAIHSQWAEGRIATQSPKPGTVFHQPNEQVITLRPSLGLAPGQVIVPNVAGLSLEQAATAMRNAGLVLAEPAEPYPQASDYYYGECDWGKTFVDAGGSEPPAGVVVKKGTDVLLVAQVRNVYPLPDCIPMDRGKIPGIGLGVPVLIP